MTHDMQWRSIPALFLNHPRFLHTLIMPITTQEYIVAAVGIAVGVVCFLLTQDASSEWMNPIISTCTSGNYTHFERMLKDDMVPYSPEFGGPPVCIVTQFMNSLVSEYPGGLLTWCAVITTVSLPFSVFSAIEAGRLGAKGPVRYCTIVNFLSQNIGACIIIPALWIPSYVFGGSKDGGPFCPSRPMAGVYSFVPMILLSIVIFWLDPTSVAWRHCAGMLGSPLLAMMPLVYYLSSTPTSTVDMKINMEAAKASYAKAYQCMGMLSLMGWIVLVCIAWTTYGLNVEALLNGLWFDAGPAVKFLTVDTLGLYIANLLYAYLLSPSMCIKTLILTPLVGPGAALCYVLATTEANYVVPKEKQ